MNPDSKILLITRSPYDWIKSFYCHEVRKGNHLCFNEWIEQNKNSIIQTLNINKYYDILSKIINVDNILFLPYELLTSNKNKFFSEIYKLIQIDYRKYQKNSNFAVKNSSLPLGLIEEIRKLNEIIYNVLNNQTYTSIEDIADYNTQHFIKKHSKITNIIMDNNKEFVSIKQIQQLINVMTKLLLQNNEKNLQYLSKIFPDIKSGKLIKIPKEIKKQINSNLTILNTFPVYNKFITIFI